MQDNDITSEDQIDDFNGESESSVSDRNNQNIQKIDAKRKLEEYLENKKLRDEFDY